MNILLLAYASEPGAGSEYGVGWMVPLLMAQRHPEYEVFVLTRSRCKEKILTNKDYIKTENLHYLFYDIPKWIFYKNEMQSHWGEQINYLSWQFLAKKKVKEICKKHCIDVIHHLTFNQYRTPSPGYWMEKPFVVGPIGGAECVAQALWQDLSAHSARKEEIRLKGRDLAIFRWFNSRSKNKKVILCSSKQNRERLNPYKGNSEMRMIPAIGYSEEDFIISTQKARDVNGKFTMIYAGKAYDWKGIHIFLRAAKRAFMDNGITDFVIKLIGIRSEEEQEMVMSWVREELLMENVMLIPFIERAELLRMMTECNLSVYPAFRDSGSMSVLEASALACPSICFDAGGQDIFPDEVLLKVKIGKNYEECLSAFSQKLLWAYEHPSEAKEIGLKAKEWIAENLRWEKKVDEYMEIYRELC